MKTITNILTATAVIFIFACGGQTGGGIQSVLAQQPKTVRAYAPEMNNMEMLSMTQLPGWQLLAGTQWIGNMYCTSVKGVNETSMQVSFTTATGTIRNRHMRSRVPPTEPPSIST